MNDYYKQKAEENNVTGLGSFIDELIYRWRSKPSLGGLPENPEQNKAGVITTAINGIKDFWNKPIGSIGFDRTESGIPYIRFGKPTK